jgi:peptide/nickel transport system substrate-binding protein
MRAAPLADPPGTVESDKVAAFRAGLVDVLSVGPIEWDMVRQGEPDFQSVVSRRSGSGVVLAMNSQKPNLKEAAVRQAVFQAIDPWDYLDTVWSGQGFASVGIPVREADWLLERSEMRQNFFADPGKARQLLIDSGQRLPVKLEVAVRIERTGGENVALEERLLTDLTSVGFKPELRRMNPVQFDDLVMGPARDFELVVGAYLQPRPPTVTCSGSCIVRANGTWPGMTMFSWTR